MLRMIYLLIFYIEIIKCSELEEELGLRKLNEKGFGFGNGFTSPRELAVAIDEFITKSENKINNIIEKIQAAAKQKKDEALAKLDNLLAGPKAEMEELRKKALDAAGAPTIIKCIDKNRSLLYNIPINIVSRIATCVKDTILKPIKSAKSTIDTVLGLRNIIKDADKKYSDCSSFFCKGKVMLQSKMQFDKDVVSIGIKIGLIASSVYTITLSLEKCLAINPASISADAMKFVGAAGVCMIF